LTVQDTSESGSEFKIGHDWNLDVLVFELDEWCPLADLAGRAKQIHLSMMIADSRLLVLEALM